MDKRKKGMDTLYGKMAKSLGNGIDPAQRIWKNLRQCISDAGDQNDRR